MWCDVQCISLWCCVFQALASVDIGSLICNVGAGGGAAPAASAGAAAPAGGDAPGKQHFSSVTVHLLIEVKLTLYLHIQTFSSI